MKLNLLKIQFSTTKYNKIKKIHLFGLIIIFFLSFLVYPIYFNNRIIQENPKIENYKLKNNIIDEGDLSTTIKKNRFYVYYDYNSEMNHYYPTGWMGDYSSIGMNEECENNPYNGFSCIELSYSAQGGNKWAGIYWQHPGNNWGDDPNGWGIEKAEKLIFWAKGKYGNESIEFKCGGIKGEYPDTITTQTTGYITLTQDWVEYSIDLVDKDLSRIAGGFCWVSNIDHCPNGAIFFLDNIYYQLKEKVCGEPFFPGFVMIKPEDMIFEGYVLKLDNAQGDFLDLLENEVEGTVIIGQNPTNQYNNDRNGGAIKTTIRLDKIYENLELKIIWDNSNNSGMHSNIINKGAYIFADNLLIWNQTLQGEDLADGSILNKSPFIVNFKPIKTEFELIIRVDEGVIWKISRIIIDSYTNNTLIKNDNFGFCYGPYRQGQSPEISEFPSIGHIWDDMCIISILTNKIRTYSIESSLYYIPKIADNFGINTLAGIWISSNQSYNLLQIERILNITNYCSSIVIGNEVLLREDLNETELIYWINFTKSKVNINITYADIYNIYLDHPNLTNVVDFITIHIYAFWEYVDINNSISFTHEKYNLLKSTYPNKEVIIGEAGWPSDGRNDCSELNQANFFVEWIQSIENKSLSGYYFGLFDEPWKTEYGVGPHWGLFNKSRLPKKAGEIFLDRIESNEYIPIVSSSIGGYNILLLLIFICGCSVIINNNKNRKR